MMVCRVGMVREVEAEIGFEKSRFQFRRPKDPFEKIWADTPTRPAWNCNTTLLSFGPGRVLLGVKIIAATNSPITSLKPPTIFPT